MTDLPFPTRSDAGAALAGALREYGGAKDTLILALVRGGVVVGRALADALKLPLFPYVVRKLGHPGHREFALGAVAEGGSTFLDDATMQASGVTWEDMEPVIEEEMQELERRKTAYLIEARPELRGKTIILTDDGAATGASLFAAIEDLRKAAVKKIIVALPVSPPDTVARLKEKADGVVVLATPEPFEAVGLWYGSFPQIEDEEVIRLLKGQ
ncbi:MAG: phosphoribosyltransferase family protein [Candidatus Peribacteraceae bacterium]|nr:phosphoribosyltransferase family protein [Candidatus Peribacteraceae bacterium]